MIVTKPPWSEPTCSQKLGVSLSGWPLKHPIETLHSLGLSMVPSEAVG